MADVTGGPEFDGTASSEVWELLTSIMAHFGGSEMFSFANAGALPDSGNWPGRIAMAEDTGAVYRRFGSSWKLLGGLPLLCTVRRSANQSLTSGSFTSIQFDTEVENDYSMWASGTPSRVTAPVTGLYAVTGGAGIPVGSTGRVATRFLVNGAEYPVGGRLNALGSQADAGAGGFALIPLTAADYVELSVFHDAGASRNVGSDAPYSTPFLSVALLG